jgi:hypothetical protein
MVDALVREAASRFESAGIPRMMGVYRAGLNEFSKNSLRMLYKGSHSR